MIERSDFPKIIVKRKNIQVLLDYCLDEAIEFTVRQQAFPDNDWEVEVKIKDVKKAILLGMFIKENRMELAGMEAQAVQAKAKKDKAPRKSSTTEDEVETESSHAEEESESAGLPFNV